MLTATMLLFGVALILGCGDESELPEWPVDLSMAAYAEYEATRLGPEAATAFLERARRVDLERMLAQDLIVLGTVSSLGSKATETGIYTTIHVDVEEVLKGQCPRSSIEIWKVGGTLHGRRASVDLNIPAHAGPPGNDPPDVGTRHIFLGRRVGDNGAVLAGGRQNLRYEVRDGIVVRKGLKLDEFLAVIARHVERRTPACLYRCSDAVVLAEVVEKVFAHRRPIAGRADSNYTLVAAHEVAKGSVEPNQRLRIALPYAVDVVGDDLPRFGEADRVVLFLSASGGAWSLNGGWDSVLHVRADGSFANYSSLRQLADESAVP